MKLKVENIIKETSDATTLCFKNGNIFKKFKYKPGQFLTIHFPINKQVHKRAYSFSSNPYTDKDLKVTIKRVDKGLVSNHVRDNVKVGDKFEVDNPAGSFYVDPKSHQIKQYVLFAGGSGVTPMFSILKSVLTEEKQSRILLIYANRDVDSIIFHQQLKTLQETFPKNLSVEHIISSMETTQDNYNAGLATKALIDSLFVKHNLTYGDHTYMICGPFGYMEAIKEVLKDNGVTRDKIKIEVFKVPVVKVTGKDLISEVTLRVKGKEYKMQTKGDKSILQQAMKNNVAIPYSCRSGMCSTCLGKCVEGEVKMIDGHLLPEKDVENGSILTCVSFPLSEKIVIEI